MVRTDSCRRTFGAICHAQLRLTAAHHTRHGYSIAAVRFPCSICRTSGKVPRRSLPLPCAPADDPRHICLQDIRRTCTVPLVGYTSGVLAQFLSVRTQRADMRSTSRLHGSRRDPADFHPQKNSFPSHKITPKTLTLQYGTTTAKIFREGCRDAQLL